MATVWTTTNNPKIHKEVVTVLPEWYHKQLIYHQSLKPQDPRKAEPQVQLLQPLLCGCYCAMASSRYCPVFSSGIGQCDPMDNFYEEMLICTILGLISTFLVWLGTFSQFCNLNNSCIIFIFFFVSQLWDCPNVNI